MNQKELIALLAEKNNLTKADTEILLNAFTESMRNELIDGTNIGIHGFGSFEVRKKEERLSVHPATQKRTLIPPKLVVSFKQSSNLKDKLNTK